MESLNDAMDRVQDEYKAEGFSFYSRSPREKFSVLIMFKEATPSGDRFTVFIFDNKHPELPYRVDCFTDIAQSKAEAFEAACKAQTNEAQVN